MYQMYVIYINGNRGKLWDENGEQTIRMSRRTMLHARSVYVRLPTDRSPRLLITVIDAVGCCLHLRNCSRDAESRGIQTTRANPLCR